MTEKLYDLFPYKTEFQATVVSCKPTDSEMPANGRFDIVLDKTCFFPEQGGQTSDRGYIGFAKVENVVICDGVITHQVIMTPPAGTEPAECIRGYMTGTTVDAKIDWTHRHANMQQHTGEHIFTGLAHTNYGCENVGFHLSDNVVTLDLDKLLTAEQIEYIEREANAVIEKNVPIRCFYPEPGELAGYDYRSKAGIEGEVRLVEIEGVDLCACCAPHVKTTGEVSFLKVIDFEKYKGGVRISILCGQRALTQWRQDKADIDNAVKTTGCNIKELPDIFLKLRDENSQLRRELALLKQEKVLMTLSDKTDDFCIVFEGGLDIKCMREIANVFAENRSASIMILSGTDGEGYDFVAGSSVADFDIRSVLEILKKELVVKGGGSPKQIQGHIDGSRENIERLIGDNKWQV